MPYSIARQRRQQAILEVLPSANSTHPGKNSAELLALLSSHYSEHSTSAAKVRSIQRDLKELLANEEVTLDRSIRAPGKQCHYQRIVQEAPDFSGHLEQLHQELRHLGLPLELVAEVVKRVQHPRSFFDLPPTQFVTVADTVRLAPRLAPDPEIQNEVLTALRTGRVLKAIYQKPDNEDTSERFLHLLGIIQRGSLYYVVAYDGRDLSLEPPPAKLFLLSRFLDALALETPCQLPANASLSAQVAEKGWVDFVYDPKPVKVKLRAKSYVRRLLEDNLLASDQKISPTRNADEVIVTATLPLSGTLFRWLLGLGNKVEVLQPRTLRRNIAWQVRSVAHYYSDIYAESDTDN